MSWGYYITAAVVDPPESVRKAILELGYEVRSGPAPPSEWHAAHASEDVLRMIDRTVVFDIQSPGDLIAEQAEKIIEAHGLCGYVDWSHRNGSGPDGSTTILDGKVVGRSWEAPDAVQHPLAGIAMTAAHYHGERAA